MMHKAWSSIEEVPYCFSRSSIKFQGHIALEIVEFDSNWAFPDCNSSLNSTMAMKCCTKLETAKKRCPIVFQGHPSNFKVTRDKTSQILTQIGRFGLQAGRSFQIPQICLVDCIFDVHITVCFVCIRSAAFNILRPSDAIWGHRSGSTMFQVMACCLTAPSHYLNQCWLITSKVQRHSAERK